MWEGMEGTMGEEPDDLSSAPGLGWIIIFALVLGVIWAIIKGMGAIFKAIFG